MQWIDSNEECTFNDDKLIFIHDSDNYIVILNDDKTLTIKTRWRKWPEEHPDKEGIYLVHVRENHIDIDRYDLGLKYGHFWACNLNEDILAWLPIPQPPKE